jgi:hemolysin III
LKFIRPHWFERVSIAFYLVMGWSGLVALRPIGEALPHVTLVLIIVGGALYSLGVVFHLWHRLRFQNAIWHGFVLAAALCHYAAVLRTLVESA